VHFVVLPIFTAAVATGRLVASNKKHQGGFMNLVERAKNIMLTPKTEWDAVAADPTPTAGLVTGYVLPLAALAAIAGFVSSAVIGTSMPFTGATFRMPMGWAIGMLIYQLVMSVVAVFVLGFIIDVLAPTFGGTKNFNQAIKVAAYSYTAAWLGAVLGIIPWVGWLLALVVSLYGFYLLFLGLPRVMKNPPDKSIGYTVVVVLVAIVVGFVISVIGGLITAPAMMAGMAMGGSPHVTYDKDSRLGKLEQFGKKMEEAGKKMEAAEKSGDSKKQVEAAMGALGTVLSGGKGVEPVQLDVLKPFLPETAAGLPRTASSSDRTGVAGLMAAKVRGEYGNQSGKRLTLEVVDTGGAAGLMGLAGWAMIGATSESENDARIERMRKDGNRMVREEISKRGGSNSYSVILADRFMVSGTGQGVDFDAVKDAVNSIDLKKIEAIK
jgi:uncharacterized membrane protein